jgi:hypothetical protein
MSNPLLPFADSSSEIFPRNYYNDDPENIHHELSLSTKSNSIVQACPDAALPNEHDSDEEEFEGVWRTNLMIEGEEERRRLRIESMMVKKTSLEIDF